MIVGKNLDICVAIGMHRNKEADAVFQSHMCHCECAYQMELEFGYSFELQCQWQYRFYTTKCFV